MSWNQFENDRFIPFNYWIYVFIIFKCRGWYHSITGFRIHAALYKLSEWSSNQVYDLCFSEILGYATNA